MSLVERRGKELHVNLHPGQTRANRSTKRIVLVLSGSQSGKTSYGPIWLQREIERCGPGDYLAASANYDLFKLKMLPEMEAHFLRALNWGTYQGSDRVLTNHAGDTRIILRSAEARGGLESATAKAAWLDEWGQDSVEVTAFEAVMRRLSISQGRVLITTTPYNLGWLKQQVYDRWVGGDEDYDVVSFKSIENPVFPVAEYERAKRTLPDWRFRMFYDGEFTRPAGLIYGDYDESKHLVKPFSIPTNWLRLVGIDFGATMHNALVWLAEEMAETADRQVYPTGRYYAYRECSGLDQTGAEYAKAALEYADPVREWRGGSHSEDEQRMAWRLSGVPVVEPQILDVEAGIDHVIGLFKQDRLLVFDTLTGLRSELGTYSRELDDSGQATAKIADKERFHRADALRALAGVIPAHFEARPPEPDELPIGRTRVILREQARRLTPHEGNVDEYF